MTLVISGLTALKTSATSSRTVLRGVSVTLDPGHITLVLGAIGAGKSTLVECIAGICRPLSGTITVDGVGLWQGQRVNPDVLHRIGVVWQSPGEQLFARSGLGEFRYTLRPLRMGAARVRQRIDESLESVGLSHQVLAENPFELSGGEQRRLLLATTLAAEPDWLIADEPTVGLDSRSRQEVIDWFRRFADKGRQGVMVVTHDLDDWLPVADKLVFIHDGSVRTMTTPVELLEQGAWPSDVIAEPTAFQLLRTIRSYATISTHDSKRTTIWTPAGVAGELLQVSSVSPHAPSSEAIHTRPTEQTSDPATAMTLHCAHRDPFIHGMTPGAKWICYFLLSFGVLMERGIWGAVLGLLVTVAAWTLTAVPLRNIWRSARPIVILYAVSALFAGLQLRDLHAHSTHVATGLTWLPITFSATAAATVLVHLVAMVLVVTLASVFSLSTTTLELKHGLRDALRYFERWHLPVEVLSLSAALVLRLIPVLQAESTRFANIARSRGKSTSRSGVRLRDIPAMMVPLTLSVLRYGESMSTALEARGYQVMPRVERDRLTHARWQRRDIAAVVVCSLAALGLISTAVLHL